MEMYILYNKKVCECFASTQKLLFFEQTYDAQKTCARRRNFMKRKNLLLLFVVAMLVIASTFTGCGNVDGTNDGNTNGQENTTNDNNGGNGTDNTGTDTNNNNGGTTNQNGNTTGDNSLMQDAANGVGDAANAVGDTIKDVANGFNNYEDASAYFMKQMGGNNQNATYELRNENRNLMEYDTGKQGYRFQLHDTSTNKAMGEYYVDATTGKIYTKDKKTNAMQEYSVTNQNP